MRWLLTLVLACSCSMAVAKDKTRYYYYYPQVQITSTMVTPMERPQTEVKNHEWLTKHPVILQLLKLTNEHRARSGLPALELDFQMCLDAQKHATWMCETGWFSHSGLPYRENIFQNIVSPEAVVNGWALSPAHNWNMLSGTKVGFGYNVKNGMPYWVGVYQ